MDGWFVVGGRCRQVSFVFRSFHLNLCCILLLCEVDDDDDDDDAILQFRCGMGYILYLERGKERYLVTNTEMTTSPCLGMIMIVGI